MPIQCSLSAPINQVPPQTFSLFFFFLMTRPPPRSTLFPSPTLSRSWKTVPGKTPTAGGFAGHITAQLFDCCWTPNLGFRQKLNSVTTPTVSTRPVLAFTSPHQTRETESLVTLAASKTIGIITLVFVFP